MTKMTKMNEHESKSVKFACNFNYIAIWALLESRDVCIAFSSTRSKIAFLMMIVSDNAI